MTQNIIKPICALYRHHEVSKAVFEVLSKLNLPDLNGKKILLKPNVGRNVEENQGINTNPAVVWAVFDFLKKKYDALFFLGDSPVTGVISREAFLLSGYQSLMKHEDITYIDLDSKKPQTLKISDGVILNEIKVSGYFDSFDYIISIPVLKMHMHTGATLSFKNMKGMIYKREKVKLHQLHCNEEIKNGYKELDIAIADLSSVLEPDLAVIDASYAMEGLGPSAGNRKKMDTIIASTNWLAADLTALAVVNLDIEHVPHLKLISKKKGSISSIGDITTVPNDISSFLTDFKTSPKDIKINNCKVNLVDVGSCSACLSSILQFLKGNEPLIQKYFNQYGHLNISVGKDIPDPPEQSYLFGNCAYRKKAKGIFIKGCPPTQSVIEKMVKEKCCN